MANQSAPEVDNDLVSTHVNEFAADHPDVPDTGPPPERKRIVLIGVVLPIAVIAVAVGAFIALGSSETKQAPAPSLERDSLLEMLPPAETADILPFDAIGGVLDIHADGNVVPFREIQVAAEVSGQIVEKSPKCEAGEYVKKGEMLLRIDPTNYELDVERLERAQRQEYEALRELDQEVTNTGKLIELAESEVEIQQRELDRLEQLGDGFASQAELDQARRARLQALNNLQTLENQLALAQRRRGRLEAAEQLAATQLKRARVDLQRTEIVAPVDGVIVREDVEVESFVSPGSQLVVMEQTGKVEVAVNLKMDQLMWVLDQTETTPGESNEGREGQAYTLPPTDVTIEYRVAGRDDTVMRWQGVLQRYDGIGLDPSSRTVPVRIVVPHPEQVTFFRGAKSRNLRNAGPSALVRGMFVHVIIHTEPKSPLVLIPTLGLLPGNRVVQFTADESVLNELREEIEQQLQEEGKEPGSRSSAEAEAEEEVSSFDASRWVAGRARVVTDIYPIDSLALGEGDDAVRYWVAQSEALQASDAVVISPLAGLKNETPIPIRVLDPEIEPAADETQVTQVSD